MGEWWSDGLRFRCRRSGRCCRTHGDYAWVYVSAAERRALAAHLGLAPRAFLDRYTVRDERGHRVLRFRDGRCPFLDGAGLCSVHEVKPVQCRTWPFWPELLSDRATWEREVVAFCPGAADPDAPVVPAEEIRRRRDEAMEV